MQPLLRYFAPVRSWLSILASSVLCIAASPGVAAVLISSLANLRLRKSLFLLPLLFFFGLVPFCLRALYSAIVKGVVHRLDTPLELLVDLVHPFARQEQLPLVQRRG